MKKGGGEDCNGLTTLGKPTIIQHMPVFAGILGHNINDSNTAWKTVS